MTIDPLHSKSSAPEAGEAGRAARNAPARGGASTPAAGGVEADSIELSAHAKGVAGTDGTVSSSGLSAARLREIVDRVTSDYYDTDRVRDTVARRVLDHADPKPAE
jgi:hypothetical protein